MTLENPSTLQNLLDKLFFTHRFQYVIDTYSSPAEWAKQLSNMKMPKIGNWSPSDQTVEKYAIDKNTFGFVVSHNHYGRHASYPYVKISGVLYQDGEGRTAVRGLLTLADGSFLGIFLSFIFVLFGLAVPSAQILILLSGCTGIYLLLRTRSDFRAMRSLLYETIPPADRSLLSSQT